MIRFDNIEVAYDNGFVAIPNFNLEINEGEFFTLLGPSGCGKTTALRTLAGLIRPTKGKIFIDGKDVTKNPVGKSPIGMVFQNYALFPTMSVYDNIAFGLKVKKLPKADIDAAVRKIAAEVDLTDAQLERTIAQMSGGQQQRVALARSMVMRPKILLLDEPLSNLDAKLRHQLGIQLKDMQRYFGVTSVYVTHDQSEALSMSDRIAVINHGRIEQCGTPREIYSHSQTEFVCNFIGDANKLSVDKLRESGYSVDADSAYVRVERVSILKSDAIVPPRFLSFEGKVVEQRYGGTVTVYLVDYGVQEPMQIIVKEDGSYVFEEGSQVKLAVNPDDILTYKKG